VTDPRVRASDADRQRVVNALERHVAAGRLTLDEYGDRVGRVLAATTLGELATLTGDLPADDAGTSGGGRQLAIAFLVAVLALALIGTVLALAR
jgi:hypothetical protein